MKAQLTRRDFIWAAAAATVRPNTSARLRVPIHRVTDTRARCTPQQFRRFWGTIWPEAVRMFQRDGIGLQTSDGSGEVKRTAGDRPVFIGLRHGVLNLVLTDHIPMYWDRGRALAGVTTIYDGYLVSVIALRYAHGNQVPYLSLNTCVHELLHAFLLDVFLNHARWYQAGGREFRVDWYATSLWLFHPDGTIRKSAETYLARMRPSASS